MWTKYFNREWIQNVRDCSKFFIFLISNRQILLKKNETLSVHKVCTIKGLWDYSIWNIRSKRQRRNKLEVNPHTQDHSNKEVAKPVSGCIIIVLHHKCVCIQSTQAPPPLPLYPKRKRKWERERERERDEI